MGNSSGMNGKFEWEEWEFAVYIGLFVEDVILPLFRLLHVD